MIRKRTIYYATKSPFKKEEVDRVLGSCVLKDKSGGAIDAQEAFDIRVVDVPTGEPLERDLAEMVRHKAKSAYKRLMAPCIVEHAGLILEGWAEQSYPGGLTQPMWDALGAVDFVKSMNWAGKNVIARAVVGYCDGARVSVFAGETNGQLANEPRGKREFYWDTVFCPEGAGGLTYAEIFEQQGIEAKIKLSQSAKALKEFLQFSVDNPPELYPEHSL
jgi:XTP/dITP diphosphohydrolase